MPKSWTAYSPTVRQQVAEMHRSGITIRQITAATGVPRRTIYRWLNWPHTKIIGSTSVISKLKGTHEQPID